MSSEESARDEIERAIRRHEADLDAEDLREIAADLEETADRWEGIAL